MLAVAIIILTILHFNKPYDTDHIATCAYVDEMLS